MIKVLMVCLGNICRSPLAEGILQSKVDPTKVFVDSAGTGGYHIGELPDSRSIAVAQEHGLDITHQRCRKLTPKDLMDFDHIYVMDRSNYQNTVALAQTQTERNKVRLLLDDGNPKVKEVPDPYYGGPDGFENVYQLIDVACERIAHKFNAHGS